MEGVQILNQFEVVTKTIFSWDAFWVGLGIGAAVGLVAAIIFGFCANDWSAFIAGCVVYIPVIGLLIGCLSGASVAREPVAWETHYEVMINEDVSMQEFMDKYEIIETRGTIYTIKER